MSYYVTNDNSFLDIKNAHLRVSGNVHATGVVTTANVEVGGELTVTGNVAVGDDLTVTGNVVVGDDLTVTGNVAVDTDTLFVDSVNNRVGVGTTSPGYTLDVTGDINIPTDGEIRKGGVVQTLGGIFSTDSTKAYYTDGPVGIANVEALTTQTLQVGANVSVNDVLSNKLSVTGSVYVTRNLHAVDLVKTYEVRCNALFIKDVRVTNQVPEDGNDVGYVPNVL